MGSMRWQSFDLVAVAVAVDVASVLSAVTGYTGLGLCRPASVFQLLRVNCKINNSGCLIQTTTAVVYRYG